MSESYEGLLIINIGSQSNPKANANMPYPPVFSFLAMTV